MDERANINLLRIAVLLSLAFVVTGCAAGSASVPQRIFSQRVTTKDFNAGLPRSTLSIAERTGDTVVLPQLPTTFTPGPAVPATRHGAYLGPAPLEYPANPEDAAAGKLIPSQSIIARLRLDGSKVGPYVLQSIVLKRWSDVSDVKSGRFAVTHVHSDRQVYEIMGKFATDVTVKSGAVFSSGTKFAIIDALTGDPLYGGVDGVLKHSAQSRMETPLRSRIQPLNK